jgi:hypothetical protein
MQIRARILAISIFSLVISFPGISQVTQDDLYSRFGLGDIVNGGSGTERAMGGAAIATRTRGIINFQNPAALNAIDTLSFILDIGLQGKYSNLKSSSQSQAFSDINAGHIAIGFPIARWWKASFSLAPYSVLGYTLKDTTTIRGSNELINNYYTGSGGTNAFTMSHGFKIYKNIYVGFNAVYLFGNLQNTQYNDFSINVQSNSYFSTTTFQTTTLIGGFYGNVGLQFSDTIAKKFVLTLGATYGPNTRVHARADQFVKTELTAASVSRTDTTYNQKGVNSNVVIPARLGLGMSIASEKFLFAFDYVQENWSSATILGVPDSLVNSRSFRAGLEYIPKYNSFTSYLARVRYRIGYHYTNTYLSLRGHQINDYGVSLGFGFPFKNSPAILNISFELGRRGTTMDNLMMENYGMIYLNIALGDIWFLKRKFE